MALVDPDTFASQSCERIYIAGKLREAKDVEAALTAHGIDYVLEIERFERKILGLIRREYDGVSFHVVVHDAGRARDVLRDARLTAGLEEEHEEGDDLQP